MGDYRASRLSRRILTSELQLDEFDNDGVKRQPVRTDSRQSGA